MRRGSQRPIMVFALCDDLLSRPAVFVGTPLHEATLWQYIEFRKAKGPRGVVS